MNEDSLKASCPVHNCDGEIPYKFEDFIGNIVSLEDDRIAEEKSSIIVVCPECGMKVILTIHSLEGFSEI